MKSKLTAFLATACVAVGLAAPAMAETQLNVVAPWSNLNAYGKVESPFWNDELSKLSNGTLTAKLSNYSELGLSGAEILRMATMGVFDIAHIVVGYSVSDDAVIEGVELAGLFQDLETLRKGLDAYQPIMKKDLLEQHGLVYLGIYPNPSQVLYCSKPVSTLTDIKGRKIRYYGTSMNEFIEAAGGSGVNLPLAEVVPSLQRGVVECGFTGTLTGYSFKWPEVASNLYSMRLGWGLTLIAVNAKKWEALPEAERKTLADATLALEKKLWDQVAIDDKAGLDCNSGEGTCPYGEPAKMTLTRPSEQDEAERIRILEDVVLKRWAARCSDECVAEWNATVGKLTGLEAKK